MPTSDMRGLAGGLAELRAEAMARADLAGLRALAFVVLLILSR